MNIIKRDGHDEEFNKDKIINAINKAFIEVDGQLYEDDTAKDIADDIEKYYKHHPQEVATVEKIQDMIEDFLMRSTRRDVARAYIRYRYKKEVARNAKDDFIKAIREKLDANDVQNQNANVDEHSFGGRIGEASSVVTKQLALDYIVSPMARKRVSTLLTLPKTMIIYMLSLSIQKRRANFSITSRTGMAVWKIMMCYPLASE